MRLRLFVATILLAGLAVAARPPAAPDAAAEAALAGIRPEGIHAHIAFLADDLLEGRRTGTRGHEIAAHYAASEFESYGLQPAGADGTWFQSVPLRSAEVVAKECHLTLTHDGQQQELRFGEDYVMGGDLERAETGVTAPVVFVGFGVTAPELGYDSYAGVDAAGKIVALLRGAPPSFPHDQRAYYSSSSVKKANAVAHGAVGLLYFRTAEDEQRLPWQRILRYVESPDLTWLEDSGAPHGVVPALRGLALLSHSGVEALFAGAPQSLDQVFADAKEGKPRSYALPVEATLRTVSRQGNLTSPNVAAVLPGSDPQLKNEYVVFSAHLDHLGIGPEVKGDKIYNGAFDNASGVAMVLELARAFAGLPERPRRSLLFLLVTGEEEGLLGSAYFAHHPTVPATSLVADVNLDMALTLYPLRDVVAFGGEHSSLGSVVEQAAHRLGLTVSPDPMPDEVIFIRSDQYSFVRTGVPSISLDVGFHSSDPKVDGGKVVQQWLHTRYHSPSDDLQQPMDMQAAAQFTRLNFLIADQIANQTARPTWNPGDFFGGKFGHTVAATH